MYHSLRQRDTKNTKRKVRDSTKAGKITRGRGRSEKYNTAKKGYFEELRTGMAYESGIDVKQAKKAIKDAPVNRNPKGTTKEQLRCKYNHPDY